MQKLNMFWVMDCSGSVHTNGGIQAANNMIRECIPCLRETLIAKESTNILVRALKFSSDASWHIEDPVPLNILSWTDIESADGNDSDLGNALKLIIVALEQLSHDELPPLIVLISDGFFTDAYETALADLLGCERGKDAIRLAVSVGEEIDRDTLSAFIGRPNFPVLQTNQPEQLAQYALYSFTAKDEW